MRKTAIAVMVMLLLTGSVPAVLADDGENPQVVDAGDDGTITDPSQSIEVTTSADAGIEQVELELWEDPEAAELIDQATTDTPAGGGAEVTLWALPPDVFHDGTYFATARALDSDAEEPGPRGPATEITIALAEGEEDDDEDGPSEANNLVADADGVDAPATVTLDWESGDGTRQEVHRSTDGGDYEFVTELGEDEQQYTDPELGPGTYQYQVVTFAGDEPAQSDPSNEVSVQETEPLEPATNVHATLEQDDPSKVAVSWDASPGAVTQSVEVAGNDGDFHAFAEGLPADRGGASHEPDGHGTFIYRVVTHGEDGDPMPSDPSGPVEVVEPEPEPTPTPTEEPTEEPEPEPTEDPEPEPTEDPEPEPTEDPEPEPTEDPEPEPTEDPEPEPTEDPEPEPTEDPEPEPTSVPDPPEQDPTPDPQPTRDPGDDEDPAEEPTEDPAPEPEPDPDPEPAPTPEPPDEGGSPPTENPDPTPSRSPAETPDETLLTMPDDSDVDGPRVAGDRGPDEFGLQSGRAGTGSGGGETEESSGGLFGRIASGDDAPEEPLVAGAGEDPFGAHADDARAHARAAEEITALGSHALATNVEPGAQSVTEPLRLLLLVLCAIALFWRGSDPAHAVAARKRSGH